MDALTALLHEDATQSMPPYDLWLRGPRGHPAVAGSGTGAGCRGSRLVPTAANGSPAFAQYKPSGPGGGARAVGAAGRCEISGDRIVELTFFLDTDALFPLFGLPRAARGPHHLGSGPAGPAGGPEPREGAPWPEEHLQPRAAGDLPCAGPARSLRHRTPRGCR